MEIRGPHIFNSSIEKNPIATRGSNEVLPALSATTKLTYVVPIRGEIANHNFFTQLRSWNQQTGDPKQFEVLYVVNNSQQEAQAKGPVFQENEKLVSLIRYIAGEQSSLPPGLAAWERQTIKRARQKGVQLRAIDLYSAGFTHETDASEQARSIGLNIAKERFVQRGKPGVIATVDADMELGPMTSEQILSTFAKTGVGMARFSYDWLMGEGGEKLFAIGDEYRFILAVNHLEETLFLPAGDFYAVDSDSLDEQPLSGQLPEQRDKLLPTGGTLHAINTRVYSQHRARVGFGKFGENITKRLEIVPPSIQVRSDFFNTWDFLLPYVDRVYRHFRQIALFSPKQAEEQVKQIHERLLYVMSKKFRAYAHQEDALRNALANFLPGTPENSDWVSLNLEFNNAEQPLVQRKNEYLTPAEYTKEAIQTVALLLGESQTEVQEMQQYIAEELHKEARRHALGKAFIANALHGLSTKQIHSVKDVQQYLSGKKGSLRATFFSDNRWIAEKIFAVLQETTTEHAAYDDLVQAFPEYLSDFQDTKYKQYAAQLRGVTRFIRDAVEHPDSHPQANLIFGYWKHEPDKTWRRRS